MVGHENGSDEQGAWAEGQGTGAIMGRDAGLAVASLELCASIRPERDENPGRQERGLVGMQCLAAWASSA